MTGHIRRRGEGTWELKFDLGTDPLTGKRITRYHSFKGTKRQAEAELIRLKNAANEGTYIDKSKTTVSDYLKRWERDWAAIHVGPKTLERYKELLRLHVTPHIGALRLQRLRAVNLAELYAKLLREGRQAAVGDGDGVGLGARTVGHVHRVLHKAFVVAVEWGEIQQNPADAAAPPKVESVEIEILNEDEVTDTLKKLPKATEMRLVGVLGLGGGLRRGEMLALRYHRIDFEAGKLRIEESLEQTKAGLRFKAPKTKKGRRTIAVPAQVIAEVKAHRKAQQEIWLQLGKGRLPDDALVFADIEGGARSPNAITKAWSAAIENHKLPKVSLHGLRHTHASQLIASGMDVLTISRRLGHASPAITLTVYGHLFSNTDDRAAEVMDGAFSRAMKE